MLPTHRGHRLRLRRQAPSPFDDLAANAGRAGEIPGGRRVRNTFGNWLVGVRECAVADAGIAFLFDAALDRAEVPNTDVNEQIGMGDYRA